MNTYTCKFLTPEQAFSLKPDLPVWFDPLWMKPLAFFYRLTPWVATCFRNEQAVAWLPLYEKKLLTFKKAFNPTLVYYSPLVFDLPQLKHANRELLREYEITRCLGEAITKSYRRIWLNLDPALQDVRGFKDNGLKLIPHYTFVKDLTQHTEFFIGETAKLRRADKEDYGFEQSFAPERLLELVYSMYDRKQHTFPADRKGLLGLLKELHSNQLVRQYNILKNGNIVSSILLLTDRNRTCYGMLTASEIENMQKGASLVLFSRLFSALGGEFDRFDLCGANSRGPSRLKAAMGADLKLFFQLVK